MASYVTVEATGAADPAAPTRARCRARGGLTLARFEIGIHNSTLAIAIALSPALLGSATMAIPAAIYGVLMFLPAAVLCYWTSRRADPVDAPPVPV